MYVYAAFGLLEQRVNEFLEPWGFEYSGNPITGFQIQGDFGPIELSVEGGSQIALQLRSESEVSVGNQRGRLGFQGEVRAADTEFEATRVSGEFGVASVRYTFDDEGTWDLDVGRKVSGEIGGINHSVFGRPSLTSDISGDYQVGIVGSYSGTLDASTVAGTVNPVEGMLRGGWFIGVRMQIDLPSTTEAPPPADIRPYPHVFSSTGWSIEGPSSGNGHDPYIYMGTGSSVRITTPEERAALRGESNDSGQNDNDRDERSSTVDRRGRPMREEAQRPTEYAAPSNTNVGPVKRDYGYNGSYGGYTAQTKEDFNDWETLGPAPILLDLDGTGVRLTELLESTQYIDSDNSGLKHKTAWAGVHRAA